MRQDDNAALGLKRAHERIIIFLVFLFICEYLTAFRRPRRYRTGWESQMLGGQDG